MQVIHQCCAGLDVHKKTVVACILITSPDGKVQKQIRTFSTMTVELLALAEWLGTFGVTQVALESMGVYWHPVFNLLEEQSTSVLVNPQHIKAVPGRKTDAKDSEWLADLWRHGLWQVSFNPSAASRDSYLDEVAQNLGPGGQSSPKGARRRQQQTGSGGDRYSWSQWPSNT